MPTGQPTHIAIPLEDAKRLATYFLETPMPYRESSPYVQILDKAITISLPLPTPPPASQSEAPAEPASESTDSADAAE